MKRAYTIRDVNRAVQFSPHGPCASASRSGELPNTTDLHLFHAKRLYNDYSTLKDLGIQNHAVLYLVAGKLEPRRSASDMAAHKQTPAGAELSGG